MLILPGAIGGFLAGAIAWRIARHPWYRREGDIAHLRPSRVWVLVVMGTAAGAALGACLSSAWVLTAALVYLAAGLVVTWTDIDVYRVPSGLGRLLIPALAVPLVAHAASTGQWWTLPAAVAGAAIYGLAFFAVGLVARMGMGDVRLAVPSGLLLGAGGLGRLVTGGGATVMLAGAIALVLLALRLRSRTDAMPYAPAIVAGTLVAVCW